MAWWDEGNHVLGDEPANAITAAWRRVLVPRGAAGLGPPTLADTLAAYAAGVRAADVVPPLGRFVLHRDPEPPLRFSGHEDAPPDLRAAFAEAATAVARAYRGSFDRAPTPMELALTLDFVVRPAPEDFFRDAATLAGRRWRLSAEAAPATPPELEPHALRNVICAYPDVGLAELAPQLEALVERRGWRVLERLDHRRGAVHPAVTDALARHAGASAFTCFEPPPVGVAAATTVMHQRGATRACWDETLVRELSAAVGGWGLCMLSDRSREIHGVGAFYAGCAVESIVWRGGQEEARWGVPTDDPRLDEDRAWSAMVARYRAISGAHESDLRWSDEVDLRSWIIDARLPPARPLRFVAGALRRAALMDVDAAQVRAAVAALGASGPPVRFLERVAPVTAAPFVLLDGEFDDAWFAGLARRLGASGTAVRLGEPDGRFTWCEVRADRELRVGTDLGASALARRLGALTVMLGEPASILRWPEHPVA